jgi:hypothetical protein
MFSFFMFNFVEKTVKLRKEKTAILVAAMEISVD